MNQRLHNEFFIQGEEARKRRGQVEVISETDNGASDHDLFGVREFNVEPASQIEVFPVEEAVAFETEDGIAVLQGGLSFVATTGEETAQGTPGSYQLFRNLVSGRGV